MVEYDDVLNKQREIIYSRRRKILEASSAPKETFLKEEIIEKIENAVSILVNINVQEFLEGGKSPEERIIEEFTTIIPFDDASKKQLVTQLMQFNGIAEKAEFLTNLAEDVYKTREEQMGEDLARQIERFVMLSVLDNLWIDHLDAVENLRQGIGLRGYGQRDPLVEYKNEAFTMFEQLITAIDDEVIHRIYKIQVQQQPPPVVHQHQHVVTQAAGNTSASEELRTREVSKESRSANSKQTAAPKSQESAVVGSQSAVSSRKKLGRNDPCWCGSGKKYKRCHYPN